MDILFEPNRKIWIFKGKTRGVRTGEILDEEGKKIGTIHRIPGHTGGRVELGDVDGTKVCEIRKKINAIQHIYEMRDVTGKNIGKIKRAMTPNIQSHLKLESEENKKMFEAKGRSLGWNYVILDVPGNEVATLSKLDKWKDQFQNGVYHFMEKVRLQINDAYLGKVDARKLVGFAIAIEDSSHD